MWSDTVHNHNKYYIMQVLKSSGGSVCYWNRYGRVGYDGVSSRELLGEPRSIQMYNKKYKEKTGKGYVEVKMQLGKAD